jgi:hypothetical protein
MTRLALVRQDLGRDPLSVPAETRYGPAPAASFADAFNPPRTAVSDITDLLVELCPSYAKKRGGVVNDVLQKGTVAISPEDKAGDLVKGSGDYIEDAWSAYKRFRKLGSVTLGAINSFGSEFPNPASGAYAGEVKDRTAFDAVIVRVRAWFKKMRTDALALIIEQTPGLTRAFNQGEHTAGLTNNQGVCNALTVDWVRRKMWNSGAQDAGLKLKTQIWEAGDKLEARMKRADKMQSAGRNVVTPEVTLAAYDKLRLERHAEKGKDPAKAKSFGQLLATASNKELAWADEADPQACFSAFQTLCEVKGDMDVGLFVGTRETCHKGHIFAFFRSKGGWTLFDSNYGEFDLKTSGPADMGAKWLEIYFTQGFRTVEVAAMVRPEPK